MDEHGHERLFNIAFIDIISTKGTALIVVQHFTVTVGSSIMSKAHTLI